MFCFSICSPTNHKIFLCLSCNRKEGWPDAKEEVYEPTVAKEEAEAEEVDAKEEADDPAALEEEADNKEEANKPMDAEV